jgi:hypothetical protein
VVRKLTQADRLLGEGKDVADVCRELQVSEQNPHQQSGLLLSLRVRVS